MGSSLVAFWSKRDSLARNTWKRRERGRQWWRDIDTVESRVKANVSWQKMCSTWELSTFLNGELDDKRGRCSGKERLDSERERKTMIERGGDRDTAESRVRANVSWQSILSSRNRKATFCLLFFLKLYFSTMPNLEHRPKRHQISPNNWSVIVSYLFILCYF